MTEEDTWHRENLKVRRGDQRIARWQAGGTVLLAAIAIAVGYFGYKLTSKQIGHTNDQIATANRLARENAPLTPHTITGTIEKPFPGLSEAVGDATVIRTNQICDFSGSVRYLPANSDLWLMELEYYRGGVKAAPYDPNRVLYSPSEYPMTLDTGGSVTRSGYSGGWQYKFSAGSGCPNPLYVGYASITKITRYAVFLVSMSPSDSGKVRQYNVAKAKQTYTGLVLPSTSRILDEIDFVQCPAGQTDQTCVRDAPR